MNQLNFQNSRVSRLSFLACRIFVNDNQLIKQSGINKNKEVFMWRYAICQNKSLEVVSAVTLHKQSPD